MKRFCFDLDGTLLTNVGRDYHLAQPIPEAVQLVNELHAAGHWIIIHTARGMNTYGGNIKEVQAQESPLIYQQLDEYGISYNELITGKPGADFYVDDKHITPAMLTSLKDLL